MTYYPDGWRTGIGYITLFPLRDRMRANLFAFRSLGDDWSREVVHQPKDTVVKALPRLRDLTGDFEVTSTVETSRIDLYKLESPPQAGLVPIGDSYQSVCPTTATGLSKVLTDVQALCDCIPQWLSTPGMGVEKTSTLYQHERKRHVDERSLRLGIYHRQVALESSLRWRVHRTKVHLQMLWDGWPEASRMTRKLTAA
jgi:2-polyprenyl-6-methoxyphenol hydroxylase-like FAD-dependent oxidoreductase